MMLASDFYVPALRWRQGEYQALLRLSDAAKAKTVPFLTVPSVEYDFEAKKASKTVQEHVAPFQKRYKAKWGARAAWIDVDPSLQGSKMSGGVEVCSFVFDELRKIKSQAVPAVSIGAQDGHLQAARHAHIQDQRGVGLRASLEHLMDPDFTDVYRALLKALGVGPAQADFVLDLGAPAYEPYDAFSAALIAALEAVKDLAEFRNFILIGTAIPASMGSVSKGSSTLPRHDWLFYKALVSAPPSSIRRPVYGDYTVVPSSFSADIDFRKISSGGKVIYTTSTTWEIEKGGRFRGNSAQMHGHCAKVVKRPSFRGADFSYGDGYIDACALKTVGASNQTRWKDVTINHHISQVLDDLSNLPGPP